MLLFGTAGKPINSKDIYNGSDLLFNNHLFCMEIEFVKGVYHIYSERLNKNLIYSAHAPYYINLNAKEVKKIEKSFVHLINTAKELKDFGVNLVFHPGFYLKQDKREVYKKIRDKIIELKEFLPENIVLRPETTGKTYQFGDYNEIIELCHETEILPCLDFAHIYARSMGQINNYDLFSKILDEYEKYFKLSNMHVHLSGISYGKSGEIKHLPLNDSKFNYIDVLKVLKDYGVSGTVICESPYLEYDAIILKTYYDNL